MRHEKENPSAAPKPAAPCTLVIFGITGDLTKRLLYPAICNLGSKGLLAQEFCIIGIGSEPYTTKSFREQMTKNIKEFVIDSAAHKFGLALLDRMYYIAGNFSDADLYLKLKNMLKKLEKQKSSPNILFYFAAPPQFMPVIAMKLGKTDLLSEEKNSYFRRIIAEKPFGYDLASAKKLNQQLLAVAKESQIFRIDHFLGKETVQNLLAFRFSNGLFEPIWNRLYIDHVQITVAETLGVESRGNYYEMAGALRDMVPNHILQILSLIAMEPPLSFTSAYIGEEKTNVLHAMQIPTPEQVLQRAVRGQYGAGKINDSVVPGYRAEKNVSPQSSTETYIALKLYVDNWRWLHVPFYVRTGKRLKLRASEIVIQFKSGPASLFSGNEKNIMPNLLRIYIQPDEGISLQFNSKVPGTSLQLSPVEMKFKYSDYFGIEPQTGYETILYDCMNGDHLLFSQAEMVETGWALMQPVLDVWEALTPREFPNYAAGSWGPEEGNLLLEKDGRQWLL
jgi:glucose-6-phosphate 1-dehydrogenase